MKIINGKMEKMMTQQAAAGYTGEDLLRRVSSQWYSGQPGLYNSTASQGGYPTIRSYTRDVYNRYRQQNIQSTPSPAPATSSAPSTGSGKLGPTGALTFRDNRQAYQSAGNAFQGAGFRVGEHSLFDQVDPVHAGNSYHNYDEAFDTVSYTHLTLPTTD